MQRLYSMFPHGLPGLGLVLLRMAIVLRWPSDMGNQPSAWLSVAAALLALAIAVGALTSVASVLLIGCAVIAEFGRGSLSMAAVCDGLPVVALILLGPGAYSLDARLFGRRTIELPEP